MRTHVGLIRGINVGGKNKLAMDDLRRIVTSLDHTEVATYIQSGNVVFAASDPAASSDDLADVLETAIASELTIRPAVIVASKQDLSEVISNNPFSHESNPKAVHAVFLRKEPGPEQSAAVETALQRASAKGCLDQARAVGRTLYLWMPEGMGRSALAVELNRKSTPVTVGTARNWATVMALHKILDG